MLILYFNLSVTTSLKLYEPFLFYADINECDESNNCHENAQCTNTVGNYTCSCNPGYTGDGINCTSKLQYTVMFSFMKSVIPMQLFSVTIIIDINECELETYSCHSNANCTDTDGSFNCTCREGFEGDGLNCTGI